MQLQKTILCVLFHFGSFYRITKLKYEIAFEILLSPDFYIMWKARHYLNLLDLFSISYRKRW